MFHFGHDLNSQRTLRPNYSPSKYAFYRLQTVKRSIGIRFLALAVSYGPPPAPGGYVAIMTTFFVRFIVIASLRVSGGTDGPATRPVPHRIVRRCKGHGCHRGWNSLFCTPTPAVVSLITIDHISAPDLSRYVVSHPPDRALSKPPQELFLSKFPEQLARRHESIIQVFNYLFLFRSSGAREILDEAR